MSNSTYKRESDEAAEAFIIRKPEHTFRDKYSFLHGSDWCLLESGVVKGMYEALKNHTHDPEIGFEHDDVIEAIKAYESAKNEVRGKNE